MGSPTTPGVTSLGWSGQITNLVFESKLNHGYTCEIKLFWNNFKFISVFYFTRDRVWNWNQIISAAERALKFYFKIISATLNVLKNIYELQ